MLCIGGKRALKLASLLGTSNTIQDFTNLSNHSPIFQGCMLELTDGWYSIPAAIDLPLTSLVHQGRIRVGDKLCVFGAEFLGSPDPAPPLQVLDLSCP